MLFYDFEVFKYDWLVVVIDTDTHFEHIIINDKDQLKSLYEANVKNIWIGFNNNHYDQYILKAILLGIDPKSVNDQIIVDGKDGWQISRQFNKIPMINYDVFSSRSFGLKTLEGFMGSDIKETDVPFNLDRKLTDEEIAMTVKYCRHDVEQTIEVFMHQINEFNAAMGLIRTFPEVLTLNDLSKTKAQLSAKILECEYVDRDDEFDIHVLPCIDLKKYAAAKEFFLNPENHWYKKGTQKNEFKLIVAGLEHTLGWGGIHAAKEKYHNDGKNCQMWHVDVASFYPRLMIFHNLLTRNSRKPEKFREIYETRIRLKHEGKKAEQAPLKVVINGTYGICKDKGSTAYDPRQANLICLNGQLMLIDLIEHLEAIDGFELIQSNTDGLIVCLPDTDEAFQQMDDICYEWEQRCNMELEFDQISSIYQKDVNNYMFKFANGKLERKGAYVKPLSPIDYDLPIINKALIAFMTDHIPVEQTINNCTELIEFQKLVKLSSKYEYVEHNGKRYDYKCYRVFASIDQRDGKIYKCRSGSNPAKFGNTPDCCFIDNDNMRGAKIPDKLDRQWYIDLAKKRLDDFGIKSI